jgi:hypothetical protein
VRTSEIRQIARNRGGNPNAARETNFLRTQREVQRKLKAPSGTQLIVNETVGIFNDGGKRAVDHTVDRNGRSTHSHHRNPEASQLLVHFALPHPNGDSSPTSRKALSCSSYN